MLVISNCHMFTQTMKLRGEQTSSEQDICTAFNSVLPDQNVLVLLFPVPSH